MRKLVLSAAVAVMGMIGMNAQNLNTEALQIGARAGYNMSNLRGDTPEGLDTKSLSGFHAGLFVEVPVSERFSVQPEVIYSTQGAKTEGEFLGVNGSTELKTQYINVPVLAKFYIADGFNIQAGPQIGFLTGAEYESKVGSISTTVDDATDGMKGTDFGLLLGAGYKAPMGLTIDARYNLGLSNVYDEDSDMFENVGTDNDFKNGVFQVGIGYQF